MMKTFWRCNIGAAGVMTLLMSIGIAADSTQAAGEYERPPVLNANMVLPKSVLKSEHFTIDQKVLNDGLVNSYKVSSPHGDFEVTSSVALYKLLGEIEAMAAMAKTEQSASYQAALRESGMNTLEGAKNLVSNPVDSVAGAGRGLSSLVSRAGEAVFQSNPGETEDSRMKQLIGFSQAKREIAHKFHVDVYSTNKELQDHLDRLAWADYTGGITISVAALPVGGAAKVVYSSSNVVRLLNEAIALTPPAELKRQNREKLEKMGMDPNLIDLFINNVQLSPRQQTYIVAALEAMTEAVNREVALMIALPVKDPEEAMAITTLIIMHAGYNNNVTKLKQLYPVKRILGARDAEGDLVLLLPVDHLTWNAKLDGVLASVTEESARLGNGKRHMYLLGTASDVALDQLKRRGWNVRTRVAETMGMTRAGTLDR
jgi:hypothetical protein